MRSGPLLGYGERCQLYAYRKERGDTTDLGTQRILNPVIISTTPATRRGAREGLPTRSADRLPAMWPSRIVGCILTSWATVVLGAVGQDKTMNSQINAVIIAALAGLTVAVLSQSSSVIPLGHIPPPDIFNPFNLRIIGYWVGVLGVLPLICVAIAIGATARKAGLRNSILIGLGAVVGVSLVISCAAVAVAVIQSKKELPLRDAGADRDSFVIDVSSFCAKMERTIKGNKASAAAIDAVCSCYGNSLADVTTRTELAYIGQHHTFPPSTIEKTNAVSQKCAHFFRVQR